MRSLKNSFQQSLELSVEFIHFVSMMILVDRYKPNFN